MSTQVYMYPEDLSGRDPSNRIVQEYHDLTDGNLLFAPRQGSFFTGKEFGMSLEYKGKELTPETDYVPLHLNSHASQRSNKEVCTIIALRFVPEEPVYFTYQCVGGPYLNIAHTIADLVSTLNLDTRAVHWAELTDLPTEWVAAHHYHNMANDMYGADPFINSINELAKSIKYGDSLEHEYILNSLENIRELHFESIQDHEKRIEILERVGVEKSLLIDASNQETVLSAGSLSFPLTDVDATGLMAWEKINGNWEPRFLGDDYDLIDDSQGVVSFTLKSTSTSSRTFRLISNKIGEGTRSTYSHFGLSRQATFDEALNGQGTAIVNATVLKGVLETFRHRIAADSIFNTEVSKGILEAGQTDITIGRTGPVGIFLVLGGVIIFEGESDMEYSVHGDFVDGYYIRLNKPLTRDMSYVLVRNTVFGEAYAAVGRYGLMHLASTTDAVNGIGTGAINVQTMHAFFNHMMATSTSFKATFEEIAMMLGDDPNLATSLINGLSERPTHDVVEADHRLLQAEMFYKTKRGY